MDYQTTMEPLFNALDMEAAALAELRRQQKGNIGKALEACGIHPQSTAWRLALLIYHITKNNGDAFTWPWHKIADDDAMHSAKGQPPARRTITAAATRLERLGFITQRLIIETGRGISHADRQIDWRGVARILDEGPPAIEARPARKTDAQIDAQTVAQIDAQTVAHIDAQTEAQNEGRTYTSFQEPKKPTPSTRKQPETWAAAKALIVSILGDWRRPLEAAQAAGVAPGYVAECVAYFKASATAHPAGHLHCRLMQAAIESNPRDPGAWLPRVELTARERRALALWQRVDEWRDSRGRTDDEARNTFTNKARADGFTDEETARVLFETADHEVCQTF